MYPYDHYNTIRRGQEELLRQAEHERMLRAVRMKKLAHRKVHLEFAQWLAKHLVSWGQRLGRLGTLGEPRHPASTSPHH
jgi:hypothetical protein